MDATARDEARAEVIARLVAQQARDDATDRLRNDGPIVRETDLDAGVRRRSGGRHRFDLRDLEGARGRVPTRFRGRSRRCSIRDDAGAWHDTTASGRRLGFPVLLFGLHPWERSVHDAVASGHCVCPVCKGLPHKVDAKADRTGHYCTYCDAAGTDPLVDLGRLDYFGIAPDTVLNPCSAEYELEQARLRRKARERDQRGRKVRGGLG